MSGEQPHKKRSNGPVISNSKAKGVLVLIGALLAFQVVTFLIGVFRREGEPQQEFVEGVEGTNLMEKSGREKQGQSVPGVSFPFDPNTLPKDSLVLLGFSPKQAQVILNYREKGGHFRRREDFARMYVVNGEKYEALKERIVIREGGAERERWQDASVGEGIKGKVSGRERDGRNKAESGGESTSIYGKKQEQRDLATLRKPWRCDLNRADSAALVKLYGIGPYFARKILRYKERLGGWFVQAEQLLEIEGMEQERFEGIREKLLIDTTGVRKFSLDTLERGFMEKHPYIGPYAARGILMYREGHKKERVVTLPDLVRENILSPGDAARLRGYIKQ